MMKKAWSLLLLCGLLSAAVWGNAQAASFDDDGVLRLVNRWEKITKHYVPLDLVLPNVPTNKKEQREKIYIRQEAARAVERLFAAAKEEEGYQLLAVSGYRPFGLQQVMFNQKVKAVGSKEKAWRKVSPAGASEHQLGLVMDMVSENFRYLNSGFGETKEGIWLAENCHRFGFIVRYQKAWEDITGCAAEPWHLRYLGVQHASANYWLQIPYETYAHAAMELPEYALAAGNAYLLRGVIGDMLEGDYCTLEVLQDSASQTEEERQAVLSYLTALYLPEGISLEEALAGEVK